MATKSLDYTTCSREALIRKIEYQKEEIRNLAEVNRRSLGECVRRAEQLHIIKKAVKAAT